jgi:hypothetical protein
MGRFFTDDIDALLKAGHGDHDRLVRIKSDFEAKKLVTIDDRRYVEGLVSRYMKVEAHEPEIIKIPEKRIVPPPPTPRETFEVKYQKAIEEKQIPKIQSKTKLRNLVISVASVVFAVLVVSFVAMNQDLVNIEQPTVTKNIEVDQDSYVRGDIISISGKAASDTTVNLSIRNPTNQQIWSESVSTRSDGEFSTLLIAGGDGWEQAGEYTLISSYGGKTDQVTFDFNPNA